MSYYIFSDEKVMDLFSSYLKDNLKDVLSRLVIRDHRLSLFEKNFWVRDHIQNIDAAALSASTSLMTNVPHVYDFSIRAKVFKNVLH